MANEIKPDIPRDAHEVALGREEFGDYRKQPESAAQQSAYRELREKMAAVPASGERPAPDSNLPPEQMTAHGGRVIPELDAPICGQPVGSSEHVMVFCGLRINHPGKCEPFAIAPAPGVSGEAHPSLNEERQVMPSVSELRENSARSLASANTAGSESVTSGPAVLSLRERARAVAEKLAELGFHRDCGNNNRLVIENELETMEEFIELAASLTPAPPPAQNGKDESCGTAENAGISTKEDIHPTATTAERSEALHLPEREWSSLSQESREKIAKWFDLAAEYLQAILDGKILTPMQSKLANTSRDPATGLQPAAPSTPRPCCPKCSHRAVTLCYGLPETENSGRCLKCGQSGNASEFFPTLLPPQPAPQQVEICYAPRSEWPAHIREFFEKQSQTPQSVRIGALLDAWDQLPNDISNFDELVSVKRKIAELRIGMEPTK